MRLLPLLFLASLAVFGEEKGAAGGMPFKAGAGNVPDFRPHVFWAYGAVCFLLGLFTVWTLLQMKRVETKIDALEGRIRRAEGNRDRVP